MNESKEGENKFTNDLKIIYNFNFIFTLISGEQNETL